jgi:NADPH-dependent ferric siderophore reductase
MTAVENTTIGLLERSVLRRGRVIGLRAWDPGTLVEVDLHLPGTDMSHWDEAQHIKCRVASYTFRDYTAAGWDVQTRTCTLYIDTAHEGPGSRWAMGLREGDAFYYAGVSRTPHPPAPWSRVVCLGDESSLGHILAFRQLLPRSSSLYGAVVLQDAAHRACFPDFFRLPMETVESVDALPRWIRDRPDLVGDAIFYVVGSAGLVRRLRFQLKEQGVEGSRIKAQGFWS